MDDNSTHHTATSTSGTKQPSLSVSDIEAPVGDCSQTLTDTDR